MVFRPIDSSPLWFSPFWFSPFWFFALLILRPFDFAQMIFALLTFALMQCSPLVYTRIWPSSRSWNSFYLHRWAWKVELTWANVTIFCATGNYVVKKWCWWGLNPKSLGYESDAPPPRLTCVKLAHHGQTININIKRSTDQVPLSSALFL